MLIIVESSKCICLFLWVSMAHSQSNCGTNVATNKNSATVSTNTADEVKPASTIFHDFLGKGSAPDSSLAAGAAAGKVRLPSEASPSASVSIGASSGGGRGPISTTSDLGSGKASFYHFRLLLGFLDLQFRFILFFGYL